MLSGEVQANFEVWATSRGFIKDGRIRALGVATATRRKASPDIPTIAEAGVPGYESGLWYALLTTAGTPRAIIDRLNRETIVVLKNPDYIKRLAEQGIEPVGSTPEELTQYMKRELDKWAKVVKDTGARID
ncbi:MAG: hypothetical protein HYS65_10420 [Betaproteobacteria bacterium]|nr:hypothetical protein [Betaproteobacteria bacterium]